MSPKSKRMLYIVFGYWIPVILFFILYMYVAPNLLTFNAFVGMAIFLLYTGIHTFVGEVILKIPNFTYSEKAGKIYNIVGSIVFILAGLVLLVVGF